MKLCNNCNQYVEENELNAFGNCVHCSPIKSAIQFSQSFLSEIKELALKIAMRQRNENHLQSISMLKFKFEREMKELAEAYEQWDELPDVAYYAAYMVVIGSEHAAREAQSWLAAEIEKRCITISQIETATLAKYRLRAYQQKNVDLEHDAILSSIDPETHDMKLYAIAEIFRTSYGSKRDFERVNLCYAESEEALLKAFKARQSEEEEEYYRYEVQEVDFAKLRKGEDINLYYHSNR